MNKGEWVCMAAVLAVASLGSTRLEAQTLRQFYLTPGTANGANAQSACATGFHMASLWEIFDVTGLEYNKTLGFTQADQGNGPVSGVGGWIRTGMISVPNVQNPAAGQSNCSAYSSTAGKGTSVQLNSLWLSTTDSPISPWVATLANCTESRRVWCVED